MIFTRFNCLILFIIVICILWFILFKVKKEFMVSYLVKENKIQKVVRKLVDKTTNPLETPVTAIDLYKYKGQYVLFVLADNQTCSDCYADAVYDTNGNYMGAVSGGFSGHGDGSFNDWNKESQFVKKIY